MNVRILFPAIFCRQPLIKDMPYRNMASEPSKVRICKSIKCDDCENLC